MKENYEALAALLKSLGLRLGRSLIDDASMTTTPITGIVTVTTGGETHRYAVNVAAINAIDMATKLADVMMKLNMRAAADARITLTHIEGAPVTPKLQQQIGDSFEVERLLSSLEKPKE